MRWDRHPKLHGQHLGHLLSLVAILDTMPAGWPRACIVWPKLSIKGAVFALVVSLVLAVKPRGSVGDFLVGYATLVTSCDSPPGLHRTPYASPLLDKTERCIV